MVAARAGNVYRKIGFLAVLNSLAVLVSLVFLLAVGGRSNDSALPVVFFSSALPFFFSGTVVSMAVAEGIERIGRVYFFDLMGAAAGCLALVPFLNHFGGPNTVMAASVLFAVSAAIWYNLAGAQPGRVGAVAFALFFVVLIAVNGKVHFIDVRYAKGQALPPEMFVQWNSFSRIGLVHDQAHGTYGIVIDADAATGIPGLDLEHLSNQDRFNMLNQGPGIAYTLRPGAKTLVIGPGGGYDVARAVTSGSNDVTAVEINPIIAQTLMQQRFPELNRNLYFRPGVHVFIEDGRSFVRRSQDKYQVLQATLVDTWASTAAGAFALSENNLYTSDAFRDYLNHLTDDGLMVFTRWGFDPPRESLRLVSLAMDALQAVGETEPWRHVLAVREDVNKLNGWGAQDTVLIFRKPIQAADLANLRTALSRHVLQPIYLPDEPPSNEFGRLLKSGNPEQFWKDYRFDISPVDDDRPFFFYTVQPRDIWSFLKQSQEAADSKINRAVPLLFELLGVSALATIIVLLLPPLLLKTSLPVERGERSFLIYFVCIGAGYILIQVALIQKFVLFLGHPTYALTVIIFSMLVASGLGSYFSRRLVQGAASRLAWALAGISVAVAGLAFVAAPISEFGVGWPLPLKMLVTAVLIAPAAFLMGIPFPTGLTFLEGRWPRAVRWAWALNAAASVLGSAGAIFLAIYIGLRATMLVGALLYLGALAIQWAQRNALSVPMPAREEIAR